MQDGSIQARQRGAHLECEQQADCFETLLTAVHVVTKEKIIRIRRKVSVFEKSQQVRVLAVDVSCDAAAFVPTLVSKLATKCNLNIPNLTRNSDTESICYVPTDILHTA